MRFTCEKSMLTAGWNIACRTVAQKSTITVLEGILCKAGIGLNLTGYNMETAISYQIDAEVAEAGECILPAKLFGDIVRQLPEGSVTVVVDENYKVSIRAGFSHFNISAESAEDYPELPDVNTGRPVHIPQNKLKELISGTIFAVSDNQSQPIHTGVRHFHHCRGRLPAGPADLPLPGAHGTDHEFRGAQPGPEGGRENSHGYRRAGGLHPGTQAHSL